MCVPHAVYDVNLRPAGGPVGLKERLPKTKAVETIQHE